MHNVDLHVQHALVVTQNDRREVIDDGAVAVSSATISAVGPTAKVA